MLLRDCCRFGNNVVGFVNSVGRNFVLSTKLKQIEHVQLFQRCRKDEISFDIVANNGNNVEATFDIVERIVRLVAVDNVASTLLLGCGRSLTSLANKL